jgi:apolipoprotein N-acyltransferase
LIYAMWVPFATIAMISIVATKKERRRRWIPCAFLVVLLLLAACGGSNVTQHGSKNYTVTVKGTSGAIQHTTQVTVTVQ